LEVREAANLRLKKQRIAQFAVETIGNGKCRCG
jgi:hypothetical protein